MSNEPIAESAEFPFPAGTSRASAPPRHSTGL
jgi:hypothetical protein